MAKGKSKGKKERNDFCKVIPAEGLGSASFTAGNLAIFCTPDTPAEVTLGEWECILKPKGCFQLYKAEPEGVKNGI